MKKEHNNQEPQTPALRVGAVGRRASKYIQQTSSPIIDRVEDMCKHFNLSEEVKENIKRIAKDSYIKGSNDCYRIYIDCR
jgi:hypothetical protein